MIPHGRRDHPAHQTEAPISAPDTWINERTRRRRKMRLSRRPELPPAASWLAGFDHFSTGRQVARSADQLLAARRPRRWARSRLHVSLLSTLARRSPPQRGIGRLVLGHAIQPQHKDSAEQAQCVPQSRGAGYVQQLSAELFESRYRARSDGGSSRTAIASRYCSGRSAVRMARMLRPRLDRNHWKRLSKRISKSFSRTGHAPHHWPQPGKLSPPQAAPPTGDRVPRSRTRAGAAGAAGRGRALRRARARGGAGVAALGSPVGGCVGGSGDPPSGDRGYGARRCRVGPDFEEGWLVDAQQRARPVREVRRRRRRRCGHRLCARVRRRGRGR